MQLKKPPFSATPLGQKLSASVPVTDNVKATRTRNSPYGGYSGYSRSRGTRKHGGLDDPSHLERQPRNLQESRRDVTRWTATRPGKVIEARDFYNLQKDKNGRLIREPSGKPKLEYLGKGVVIEFVDSNGDRYRSRTLHHYELAVKPNDTVRPGDVIAYGAGNGDQFKSPNAGKPHVHWELRRNGQLIDPTTGAPYDHIFPERKP